MLSGIAWSSFSQVIQALLSAAAMLVLVRIIPPADYGEAAVVVSFLAVFNAFAFDHFASQSLQLKEGEVPDWGIHFSFGFFLQSALFILANLLALGMRFTESYKSIAPLLHVASIVLILSWPMQIRLNMLKRALDFRRLRLLQVAGTTISIAVSLTLGLLGKGAYAIVLSNALAGVPFVIDLALFSEWKPPRGWWKWRDWSGYRQSTSFGMQVAITGLFYASRGAMEGAILPGSVGFTAIGLMGRALALYRLTFGRIATAINETIYPLLPQSSADLPMYHRRVGIFLQAVFFLTIPGAVFVGIEGPALSRIVYGMKWVAADPLFLPASLVGAGLAIFTAVTNVILARNKMRDVIFLSAVFGIATIPALLIPVLQGSLTGYLWALAATQGACCVLAFVMGRSSLPAAWLREYLTPVAVGTGIGSIAVILITRALSGTPAGIHVAVTTPLYAVVVITVIQTIHPTFVTGTLRSIPRLARFAHYFERLSLRRIPADR